MTLTWSTAKQFFSGFPGLQWGTIKVWSQKAQQFRRYKKQWSATTEVSSMKVHGRLILEPKDKAEVLNKWFKSTFREGPSYSRNQFKTEFPMVTGCCPKMDNITVLQEGVKNKMAARNPNKPTRPHGVTPRDIKELQSVNSLTDDYHPILTSNRSCNIKLEGCPCCTSLQEGRALWSIQLQAYFPWQAYLQGSWAHHCQWHHEPHRG